MKIKLSFKWYTDGDWKIDINEVKKAISKLDAIECVKWDYDKDDKAVGEVSFVIDDKIKTTFTDAWREAAKINKILLCSIHVYWTHYYVLEELYDMFIETERFLWGLSKENNKQRYDRTYMSGNYEGTEIEVTVEK